MKKLCGVRGSWIEEHPALHGDCLRKQGKTVAVAVALWQMNQLGSKLRTELTRVGESKEKEDSPGRRQREVCGLSTPRSGVSCAWGKDPQAGTHLVDGVWALPSSLRAGLHVQVHLAEQP